VLYASLPVADRLAESDDAALPFLSGTAALLLASMLAQLDDGPLMACDANHWRLHLELGARVVQPVRQRCADACGAVLEKSIRAKLNCGRRWVTVDRI